VRLQTRLDAAVDDSRRHLNDEISRLLNLLETGNAPAIDESLTRVDALRDELNSKLDSIRADMLALLLSDADLTTQKQRRVTLIAAFLTLLAADPWTAVLIAGQRGGSRVRSGGLLEGAKAVEAGDLDGKVPITFEGRNRTFDHGVQSDG
jgi:adenylate cyclase